MSFETEAELQQAYLKLVRDPELDRLELALNEPNIFSILSIENMEIRHSNFLGWLLNPKESHGLNDMFLKRFLREIFFDGKIKELQPINAERLDYQKVEIRREWKRIDLLIKFPDLVICIENKIWSRDHSEQLKRYKDIITSEFLDEQVRKVFVYLTPYGSPSSDQQETYAFVSYQHIIEILERVLGVYNQLIPIQASIYIKDYIKSLKRNLMGVDITNEMARDIYRNHKKLIDFIFSNRPNAADEYAEVGREVVAAEGFVLGSEQSNFVRFLSKPLKKIVPNYSKPNGWINSEAMLFELQFNDTDLILKLVASPAEDKRFRTRLLELLSPKFTKIGSWYDWMIVYEQRIKISYGDAKLDRFDVESEIKGYLNKLKPIIEKVEGVLLAHKEELAALKQEIEKK